MACTLWHLLKLLELRAGDELLVSALILLQFVQLLAAGMSLLLQDAECEKDVLRAGG